MPESSANADLEYLAELVRAWAAGRPSIVRLWFYGSRVRGTHRPDSDLDVAHLIDRLPIGQPAEVFEAVQRVWQAELSALLDVRVHLLSCHTGKVDSAVRAEGLLVYDRHAAGG